MYQALASSKKFVFQKQLLVASMIGNKEAVVSLLDRGVDPNCKHYVSFGCLELESYVYMYMY